MFEPRPVQASIPIWVASRWPNRRPLQRAARYDGLFPIEVPTPENLAALVVEVGELRGDSSDPYEVVVTHPPGTDLAPWVDAGATWCLTGWGPQPALAEVIAALDHDLDSYPV